MEKPQSFGHLGEFSVVLDQCLRSLCESLVAQHSLPKDFAQGLECLLPPRFPRFAFEPTNYLPEPNHLQCWALLGDLL